ncbi:Microtubule-associated protein 10 [Anabarilius grahami]|uniref:Microtubule-associated protein 10 n=1 Tax=Anabarilius grahami TaxID=495550 RepID=A0A3N0XLG8_ANAGA|nr:Microtubule-associated protein 10 [Anabarilius grahami]
MSSTQETLFSLELVIDYVRVDGARGSVLAPAVGVRFLDFPTLLIYQSEHEDVSSKSGCADLCVSPEALSQQDDGDNLKYSFHKGKSCLFKMHLDSLHTHLLNTPLYAMVLDVKDEIPKLIGSSLISLAKVMERIKLDVGKHGIGCPSAYGERLLTSICNLMGKSIGAISLAYKIVSLGAHLIPHIPENTVGEVSVTRGEAEQHESVHAKCEMPTKVTENHPGNVLSPQISLDGQSSDVVISGLPAEQRVSWTEDAQEYTEFCPPPLFYSSGLKNQQERKSFTGLLEAIESLNIEDPEDGNNEDVHDFPEISAVKADRSSKLTSTPRSRHEEADSAQLGNVIRQLPLLNALLVELSQLNGLTQEQPLSIHPHLAWLYTSAPGAKTESQKTINASPKQRPCQCKIKGGVKSVKSASGAKKNEEKLQPKRTLKYGLTKSFRLRLKLVKPGLAKRHECIKHQNIKQDQPTKQTSSDHKRVRKSVYRGHDLDETIETLVSSIEMDPTPIKTASSKRSNESLAKHVAETTLDERDKKVQVHIPSALSDRSEQHSDLNNPGIQSFKENSREDSRASSRPRKSSLSNGSFEQEEYQDDFTSLNTTDGYSPDPLSSPEPNRRKTNSGSSTSTQNRGLPVPVKAENSPLRSLKGTHVIRPRVQTSALSLSSDDSEDESSGSGRCRRPGSQSSGQKTQKSESFDSDPAEKGMTFSRVSKDSDSPANNPVLKSISSPEHSDAEEERDKLGSLGLDRNCHHISELVFNKLPGYTL